MGASSPPVLPEPLRREAAPLFDVSMWCLGRDVLHPDNLLLRRGLVREPRPPGRQGTSAYRAALGEGGALTVWGFGVVRHTGAACVYVPRSSFHPLLLDAGCLEQPVFQAEELGVPRWPTSFEECSWARCTLVALARWLALHEEWVTERLGPTWRCECLAALKKTPPLPAEGLAQAWRRWAERVETLTPLAGA